VNAEALMHLVGALHQRGLIQLLDETKQLKTKGLWSWTRVERNLPRTRVLVVGSGSAHKPVVGWPSYSISKATLYAITRIMIKEGARPPGASLLK
jgi:NAD(P)-dependent dehydrogenase (short-subunit alcohol dehydrogenase family)